MSIVPKKVFINNEIPLQFNTDSFETTTLNSDNLSALSLNISGQSNLNNVDLIGNLNSVNIVNSGSLTSNTITSSGLVTCNNGLSVTNGGLTSNTITSTNLLTASNGLTVSAGTVSFVAGAIPIASVNGCNARITTLEQNTTKLINITSGNTFSNTISTNTLSIDYSTNNNRPNVVTATANFSMVVTNVPTISTTAHYRIEVFITGKFYCTGITVNGTVLTMTAVGGFANIASQVNASATGLIQTFTIFFAGSTTPSRVITELKSTW